MIMILMLTIITLFRLLEIYHNLCLHASDMYIHIHTYIKSTIQGTLISLCNVYIHMYVHKYNISMFSKSM